MVAGEFGDYGRSEGEEISRSRYTIISQWLSQSGTVWGWEEYTQYMLLNNQEMLFRPLKKPNYWFFFL